MYKVIVKCLTDGFYDTPFVNQLYHKGDVITIEGEQFEVIGGTCLPKI